MPYMHENWRRAIERRHEIPVAAAAAAAATTTSTGDKLQAVLNQNNNNYNHHNNSMVGPRSVTLPPISSFDHLLTAADREHVICGEGEGSDVSKDGLALKSTMYEVWNSHSSPTTFSGPPTPTRAKPFTPLQIPVSSKPASKPRRKKECPICHNFYANLSTHRSSHLQPENKPHKCPVCGRGFTRHNDLLRHRKRHWKDEDNSCSSYNPNQGTFRCPYKSRIAYPDSRSKGLASLGTTSCHATGKFSRCDTFKNHLRALHFEYPPGTRKKDRGHVPGKCKHCGQEFASVNTWLNTHVGKGCGNPY